MTVENENAGVRQRNESVRSSSQEGGLGADYSNFGSAAIHDIEAEMGEDTPLLRDGDGFDGTVGHPNYDFSHLPWTMRPSVSLPRSSFCKCFEDDGY
jgi:hypothetical protein